MGIRANSEPVAGEKLSMRPVRVWPGKASAVIYGLAQTQPLHLGLLEVGDDIGFAQRHQRHELAAGAHILADADLPGPHHPGGRRPDDGAIQVDPGLFDGGAGQLDLGQRLAARGGQGGGGATLGLQSGLGLGDAGAGLGGAGTLGLDALVRDPALRGQTAVTIGLGAGEVGLGLGLGDPGGAGLDLSPFLGGAGIDIVDGSQGGAELGLGLGQGGAGVGIVQPDQDIAGLNPLVVRDQHLDDAPVDLAGNQHGVGLDKGVVGLFPTLLALPPDDAPHEQDDADDAGDNQRKALTQRG